MENGVGDQSLPGSALEVIETQLFFQLLVRLLAPGRNGVSEQKTQKARQREPGAGAC